MTFEATSATMGFPARFWGHLKTITHHKILVGKLCFRAGLYRQGLTHDLSKYSPKEFWSGVKYYQGFRSPNAAERDAKGYSAAWLHHKGRNRHHYEYWTDILTGGDLRPLKNVPVCTTVARFGGIPMPTRYIIEMFCDRMAACRVYLKDEYTDASPLGYFQRESAICATDVMHPDTRDTLLTLLNMLAEQGEDAVFAYIRAELLPRVKQER